MRPAIWTGMYEKYPLHEALAILNGDGWQNFEISSEHLVAIETAQHPKTLIKKAQTCLKELEIAALQAHAYLQANIADPDKNKREGDLQRVLCHLDIAVELGVKDVVIHPGRGHAHTKAEQERSTQLNVEAIRRMGEYVRKSDMRICIENLPHRGATTPEELLELLKEIDQPEIGIAFDTSHAHMSGVDVSQAIVECGKHLLATHISDNNGTGDQHLTPGSGTIDWSSVMKAFQEINYHGLINLEIPGERHEILALREMKTCYSLKVTEWLIALADENRIEIE